MTLEDIYRLLRTGHIQAQGVFDTIDSPLLVLDENICVLNANPAFFRTFRVDREETLGKRLSSLGNGQWNIPELIRLLAEVIPKSTAVIGYEVTHDFPGLGRRTMALTARRLVHPDNNSLTMLIVFDDITERRQQETSKDLLVGEVEHRLKNFLSLASALARQLRAEGEGAARYRDAFLSQLEALVAAELTLFTRGGHELASLLGTVLGPYVDKVRIKGGPQLEISRRQLRPLIMVLHELATNAQKHGALSSDDGSVEVGWTISEEEPHRIVLDWRETGGPSVANPAHEGFGTKLISSILRTELGGTAELEFKPGGLTVRIELPIESPLNP
ncbi:PAS domain-containing protein [Aestuariivirga sp.]|uniref:PAS domain-containing protein n=1 Tax=Aestuariivirga sp. TaxID=2650926 RepID=UPI00391AA560